MLSWTNDRWHLNGRGIHAGDCLEIRWPDGTWGAVRIESSDRGRTLFAHFDYHGMPLCIRVDDSVSLRWPQSA